MLERLQKIIASAGIGSRRTCERYISEARVEVNGTVVTQLGAKADPDHDVITFDGEKISAEKKHYFAYYKPKGIICNSQDEFGRDKVIDVFFDVSARLYTVGRLDIESEGLIFITNDGDFSQAVIHPRRKIFKTYIVEIEGKLNKKEVEQLEQGIWFDGIKSMPARLHRPIVSMGERCQVKISISEGRKRQVRRMFEVLGHDVRKLKRIEIGSVSLGNLKSGQFRKLTKSEIQYFLKNAS